MSIRKYNTSTGWEGSRSWEFPNRVRVRIVAEDGDAISLFFTRKNWTALRNDIERAFAIIVAKPESGDLQ